MNLIYILKGSFWLSSYLSQVHVLILALSFQLQTALVLSITPPV